MDDTANDPLAGVPLMEDWSALRPAISRGQALRQAQGAQARAMSAGEGMTAQLLERAEAKRLEYERDVAENKLAEWLVSTGMVSRSVTLPTSDRRRVRITVRFVK